MTKRVTDEQISEALESTGGNVMQAARLLGISRSTLRNRMGKLAATKTELRVDERHRYQKQIKALNRQIRELTEAKIRDDDVARLIEKIAGRNLEPPAWTVDAGRGRRVDRAIVTAMLSDTHYDEVVSPEEVNYVNGYNREIATARTANFFKNLIRLSRDYINGIKIDGLVLPLGGDMVSGNIHEELKETNEDHIVDTCLYYSEQIAAGIRLALEHFDKVFVPCVVGNHGRMDRKPRHKGRARDSFDYLIYNLLAREFRGVREVSFGISPGADYRYTVYRTRYQLTHGDQFRGGSGIAGLLSPLMIGDHRKRKREQAVGTPYDYLIMGHWHQLSHFKGLIVNGSLKGYDEFAMNNNFDFEPPQQAFWLTDPEHGKTIDAPIHVLDDGEYWRQEAPKVVAF